MKRRFLLVLAAAAAAFCSCSPASYVVELENRAPSASGLDLGGKSVALIYLESENGCDSLFNNRLADVLTYSLEDSYFDGKEGIGVYNLVKDPEGDYTSIDTASTYVMLLNSDVIMILDTPELSDRTTASGSIPEVSTLYIYDSLGSDEVVSLQCRSHIQSLEDAPKAASIGSYLSGALVPGWNKDFFEILYMNDIDERWYEAVGNAADMNWDEAIKFWMKFAKSSNYTKAAVAQYNIALGCYINGQYELAGEWLDMADENCIFSASRDLRKKIQAKLK